MLFKKVAPGIIAGFLALQSLEAQTFETRTTAYSKEDILEKLQTLGTARQWEIRDSVMDLRSAGLGRRDTIETFFNDYHMGLVIYRKGRPFELLGFWDPDGLPVQGGSLVNGSGLVQTPFNPALVHNFSSESVVYEGGAKHGPSFYYCDCSKVLRKGTFTQNKKTGLWIEYDADGNYITQKDLGAPDEEVLKVEEKDWLVPTHCMMQRDIKECPNLGGGEE